MLKKPSTRFPKALQGWLGSKKIEEVECVISDIAGVVRGKAMPLSKFDRLENVYMPSSILYQTISGDFSWFRSSDVTFKFGAYFWETWASL